MILDSYDYRCEKCGVGSVGRLCVGCDMEENPDGYDQYDYEYELNRKKWKEDVKDLIVGEPIRTEGNPCNMYRLVLSSRSLYNDDLEARGYDIQVAKKEKVLAILRMVNILLKSQALTNNHHSPDNVLMDASLYLGSDVYFIMMELLHDFDPDGDGYLREIDSLSVEYFDNNGVRRNVIINTSNGPVSSLINEDVEYEPEPQS